MGKGQQSNEVMVMAVACADELNCRGFCVEGRPDGHVAIVEHGVAAAGVSRFGDTAGLSDVQCSRPGGGSSHWREAGQSMGGACSCEGSAVS